MKSMRFQLIIKASQPEGVSFAKQQAGTAPALGILNNQIALEDYPEVPAEEKIVQLSHNIFEKLKKANKLDPEIKLKFIHSSESIAATTTRDKTVYLSSGFFMEIEQLAQTRPQLASEDQIASVLAHELAHNLFEHKENPEISDINLNFIEEYEADKHGLEIMDKAGFNVKAAFNFFDRVAAKSDRKRQGGDLSVFSSHPSAIRRKAALENLINKKIWKNSEKEINRIDFKSLISEKYQNYSNIEKILATCNEMKKQSHPAMPFKDMLRIKALLKNAETEAEVILILNNFHEIVFRNAWLPGLSYSLNEDLWLLVKGQQREKIENEDKTKEALLKFVSGFTVDEKQEILLKKLKFFQAYQEHYQSMIDLAEEMLTAKGNPSLGTIICLLEKVYFFQGSSVVLIKHSKQFEALKTLIEKSSSRSELVSILSSISQSTLYSKLGVYNLLKSFIEKGLWLNLSELIFDLNLLIEKSDLDENVFFLGKASLVKKTEDVFYDLDEKNIKFSLPFLFLLRLWNKNQYELFYDNLFQNFNQAGMWALTKIEGRQVYFTPLHHLFYMLDRKDLRSQKIEFKNEFVQWVRAAFAVHLVETKTDKLSRNTSQLLLSMIEYIGNKTYIIENSEDYEGSISEGRYSLEKADLLRYFHIFMMNLGLGLEFAFSDSGPNQFEYPPSLIKQSDHLDQKYFDYNTIKKIKLQNFDSFVREIEGFTKKFNSFSYKYVLQSQIANWLDQKSKILEKLYGEESADALDLISLQLLLDYEQYEEFKSEFFNISKKLEKKLRDQHVNVNESDFEAGNSEDYLSDDQKIILEFLDKGYKLALKEKKFDGLNLLEQLQLLSKIYPVQWTIRDNRFLNHFEKQSLEFDGKRLLLSYLVNPYLRIQEGEKLFLELNDEKLISFEDHLELILKIFPDYSLNRDEKLNNLLLEKGFYFRQAQMSERYFTDYGFMNQSDTVHFQNVGLESMRDLMAMFDAQTRVDFFLWTLDLGPEPWLLRDLRLSAKIPVSTFKKGINQASLAEKELFLKEFLIGPVGLLTSRRVSNISASEKFYDRIFEVAIPGDMPLKTRQQLKLIFSFLMQSMAPDKKVSCLLSMIEARKNSAHFSELAVRFLEEMGILGIKIAQYLVSRTKILSPQMELVFLKLTDRAKPIDKVNVFRFLEKELQENFSKIDQVREVLGAASIKQVQILKLKDGTMLAAKIQRPGLREGLSGDFELIDRLFLLVKTNRYLFQEFNLPESFAEEIKNTLIKEIEFTEETANQMMIAKNVKKRAKASKEIKVEVPELTDILPVTRTFIGEQYVDGSKRWSELTVSEKKMYAKAAVIEIFQQIFEDKHFHADPHPGNMLFKDNRIYLIDYGQVGTLSVENEKWLFSLLDSFVSQNLKQLEGQVLILHQNTPEEKKKNISGKLLMEKLNEYFYQSSKENDSLLKKVQGFTLILNELGIYLPETFYLLMKTLNSLNYLIETNEKEINQFIYDFMKNRYQKFKLNPMEKKYQMSESEKKKYYDQVTGLNFGTADIDLSDIVNLTKDTQFRKKGFAQVYFLQRDLDLTQVSKISYFTLMIKEQGEEHLAGKNAGVHFLRDAKNYEVFVKNEWVNLQDLTLTAQSQSLIRSENSGEKWSKDFIKGGTKVKINKNLAKILSNKMIFDYKQLYKMNAEEFVIFPTFKLESSQEVKVGYFGLIEGIRDGLYTEKEAVRRMSAVLGTVAELGDLELEIEGRWVKLKDLKLR